MEHTVITLYDMVGGDILKFSLIMWCFSHPQSHFYVPQQSISGLP